MAPSAVIQMQDREAFERNVTRALLAGAGAGLLAHLSRELHRPLPLVFLAVSGTALACVRGDKLDRIMLAVLAVLLPAAPWAFGLSTAWTVALAGAGAGVLMVKARLTERGEEGSVGAPRPGLAHYVVTALLTAGLALAGSAVAKVISTSLISWSTPPALTFIASGAILALFVAIGGIAAHLALTADPVEARCEALLPTLTPEFEAQLTRALALYRHCGQQLAALPREPAREELARTLQRVTREAAELAGEWAGVEAQLQEHAHEGLQKEIDELRASARAARDAVARQQLEAAAQSLEDELGHLAELRLKRERVLARVKSQVALLERARVALLGMRTTHATVRAAEMSAVTRRLSALAQAQSDEARVAHEVATAAELGAVEQARADDAVTRALAPVTPVGDEGPTPGLRPAVQEPC